MLAHRMADYYLLGHGVDSSMSSVRLYKTPNSRMYVNVCLCETMVLIYPPAHRDLLA